MLGAVLNISLNYLCIKKFGYIAAAYTTLFCYIVFTVSHYIYMTVSVKKMLAVSKVFNTKRISLLAVSILFVGLILIGLYDKIIIRYLFIICGLGTLYFKRKQIINISKLVQRK